MQLRKSLCNKYSFTEHAHVPRYPCSVQNLQNFFLMLKSAPFSYFEAILDRVELRRFIIGGRHLTSLTRTCFLQWQLATPLIHPNSSEAVIVLLAQSKTVKQLSATKRTEFCPCWCTARQTNLCPVILIVSNYEYLMMTMIPNLQDICSLVYSCFWIVIGYTVA